MKFIQKISIVTISYFLVSCTTASSFNLNDYSKYRSKVGSASEGLPPLTFFHDYQKMQFTYRLVTELFFESEGMALFIDYDENNYVTASNEINERYEYITEPIGGKYIQFPVTEFTYGGYDFKISPQPHTTVEGKTYFDCKTFTMVGFDHDKYRIALLYYYDFDIDYLVEDSASEKQKENTMPNLIKDNFFWRR